MIDWPTIFDDWEIQKGASEEEIEIFAKTFNSPLSEKEIAEIQTNLLKINLDIKEYNPGNWTLPNRSFPPSFLDFLTWNNGGWCRTGEREFGFLATFDLREYTLAYMFPEWMPGAVPFALDGGGVFYIFDMREESQNGEYPILVSGAGNLDYEYAKSIGNSFLEVCQGTTDIGGLL
jgi:hypothetical protein